MNMRRVWVAILLSQVAVAFLFTSVLAVALRMDTTNRRANTALLPVPGPQGEKGEAAVVDYAQITEIVRQEVELLPKPKDGKDGAAGYTPVKGVDYFDGKDAPAVILPAFVLPELRANPSTNETEWRCPGDTLWTTLISNPILEGSCNE